MEVIIGKTAGFCYGVRNAVTKAEEKVRQYKSIYCLGELVHNGEVVKKLEDAGLKTIENIEEANGKVIIRAHGIPKEIYAKAEKLGIEVFDYTCPSVLKTHKIADEYAKNNYFIFFIGNKQHPETIGTVSFCGENYYVIENLEDINEGIKKLKESNMKKLFILAQTTFSLEKFNDFIDIIKSNLEKNIDIKIENTICNATKMRQEETANLSKKVECMIIVGGKNSSNTRKLYDVSKENCVNTFLVEKKDELNLDIIKKFKNIGIMAGASTPNESINEIVKFLYIR